MRLFVRAAVAAAMLASAGCTAYHPAYLSSNPYGHSEARDRPAADPSLALRYPYSSGMGEDRNGDASSGLVSRQAETDSRVQRKPVWKTTWLERRAERKSIDRDLPHAVVAPLGTAVGH